MAIPRTLGVRSLLLLEVYQEQREKAKVVMPSAAMLFAEERLMMDG
jgi:hypothetical protein